MPALENPTQLAVSLADIEAARERVRDAVYLTPCAYSHTLSEMTGLSTHLKLENLQMTGAFKERGALNRISLLTPEQAARGVIAASAGNHAQGVAYHATRRGIKSTIVMPETTPLVKVTATRRFGADVILHGANYDAAHAEARRRCDIDGSTFIRLPSMQAALAAGEPVTIDAATTIGDGIAVRRAGEKTLPLVKQYVDEIVTVDEDEIAAAILMLLEREKTLAEGAGATALAALLQKRTSLPKGAKTAVLVCGGNIDVTLLSRIIERGLVQDGRLIRLRIHLLDRAGALQDLTKIIAEHGVNIVDTLYNRAYYGVNLGDTTIDITMETRGRDQLDELLMALTEQGYRHSRVL
jgi:threonine dehydratase